MLGWRKKLWKILSQALPAFYRLSSVHYQVHTVSCFPRFTRNIWHNISYVKSAMFWDFTQRRLVDCCWRLVQIFGPVIKGQTVQQEFSLDRLTLEDGTDMLSRNVGKKTTILRSAKFRKCADLISAAPETWNQAFSKLRLNSSLLAVACVWVLGWDVYHPQLHNNFILRCHSSSVGFEQEPLAY